MTLAGDDLSLSTRVTRVDGPNETEMQQARCIVVERMFGLGGLRAQDSDDPAESSRQLMSVLGILPGQPPPRDTVKWSRMKRLHAET